MRLLFHAGLNKAASSYVQCILAEHATHLEQEGIYFPTDSLRDVGRNTGLIGALSGLQAETAACCLQSYVQQARQRECGTLLLSNESMYHQLVRRDRLEVFKTACEMARIEQIKLLLIFRDPVSHAVSAYTHRAGLGPLPSFQKWIAAGLLPGEESVNGVDGYEFWEEIRLFEANWHVLKTLDISFASVDFDLSAVLEAFTGIHLPEFDHPRVNLSPNCVEAEVLRLLRCWYPEYIPRVRNAFKKLPRGGKASDHYIRDSYEDVVYQNLGCVQKPLQHLQSLLNGVEIAKRPQHGTTELFDDHGRPYLLLSETQLEALLGSVALGSQDLGYMEWARRMVLRVLHQCGGTRVGRHVKRLMRRLSLRTDAHHS